MHVLIVPSERMVSAENPVSGIFQLHQAVALYKAGVNVGVVAPAPKSIRNLRSIFSVSQGLKTDKQFPFPVMVNNYISWCPGRFNKIMQLSWNRFCKQMLHDYVECYGRPDLIHAHNVVFSGVSSGIFAKELGIPYIITEHSSGFSTGSVIPSRMVRVAYRYASARIMVSPFLGTKVEALIGKDATPWGYIPNILEPIFAEKFGANNTNGSDLFRFLCVAQFVPIKNHVGLIQAFASVFRGNRNVKLVLGGSGQLFEDIRELVVNCGVPDQVEFLGLLSREQVVEEMSRCDSLVLPSYSETFGVVLIEAMACGKPVVAPSGSGCEAIVNENNGLLFTPGDGCDLAEALKKMFDSSTRFNPVTIRNECISKFSESAVINQLLTVYNRVLSENTDID